MHGFSPKPLCMGTVRLKKDKEIEEECKQKNVKQIEEECKQKNVKQIEKEGKQKNVKQINRGRRLAEKCENEN